MAKTTAGTEIPTFDLDTFEFEKPDPFTANVRDRVLHFSDPQDAPWTALVNLENDFYGFLAIALEDREEQDYFLSLNDKSAREAAGFEYRPVSGRELRALMNAYASHYGLDTQGNGVGSPS